ncbi:hypothetical protein M406DRAFT_355847 [Cryphonectria parasitica EP155]|uniref:Uncharacterized protein n=1 Tax=Cryphonectria parasitica (strain ATCC 38755 / EP155) TaxID=660469 RepID=A0A9P4Y331_CRYP1|nr:uncharacterized protein M406DRAFT_355847 [Cryphonectria parasitica EP155]KAF3765270.1 hypothetical protein M406DRAFT_355847 [Cryphonectria parasitica EP155]
MQFAKYLAFAIAMAAPGLALPVDERAIAPTELAERSYLIVAADEEPSTVEKRSYLIVSADEEPATVERRAQAGDTLIAADGTKYSLVAETEKARRDVDERSYLIVAADEEPATAEKRSYLIVSADEEPATLERRAKAGDTLIAADGTKYSLVAETK